MLNRFHTGPGGFLLDTDSDGHPDDLAARIALPSDIDRLDVEFWCGLVDLAARLGLETIGLPDRLVVTANEETEPGIERLQFSAGDEEAHQLARAGLPVAVSSLVDNGPADRLEDLGQLFTGEGLLADRDNDWLPDGTRVVLRLPDPCPPAIGVAAIELAARIGLESGGITLPLAVGPNDAIAADRLVLDLTPRPAEDLAARFGRLRLIDGRLSIEGDAEGVAALVQFLATTWPRLAPGDDAPEIRQTFEELRSLTTAGAKDGAPRGDDVFALRWRDEWEVDRVRRLVREELIPLLLPPGAESREQVDLLVLVSEPPHVRRALEAELAAMLTDAGIAASRQRVRVRSAYKAGLSWLREDVIPALSALDGIDRIEVRYARAEPATEGKTYLDLPIRWLQELFPGDELMAEALGLPHEATALVEGAPDQAAIYEAAAYAGSTTVWADAFAPRWYDLPYIPLDPAKGMVRVSTGSVRATVGDRMVLDRAVPTDGDRFWAWFQGEILPRVGAHILEVSGGKPDAAQQPFFADLEVNVSVSEPNELLAVRQEIDSAAEALHEDVYFGALDWFATFGEQHGCADLSAPGAILPFIHVVAGEAPSATVTLRVRRHSSIEAGADSRVKTIRVVGLTANATGLTELEVEMVPAGGDPSSLVERLRAAGKHEPDGASVRILARLPGHDPVRIELPMPQGDLTGVEPAAAPPPDDRILFGGDLPPLLARFAARPGVRVWRAGQSFQGRPVWALALRSPARARRWSAAKWSLRKPTVLIEARHHANEVSSTTASFLLAELLTTDPDWQHLLNTVNVVILPFKNPDGAALHEALVAEHPTWKHHAARYNAAGLEIGLHELRDDTPFGEARVRGEVWRQWLPDVVIDNHGVPSHEWSQHFAGFGSPPRFGVSYWIPQALLYGIIHHVDEEPQRAFARTVRERVARAIAADPDLDTLNRTYGDRYRAWGASRVPDRFPAEYENDFLCYLTAAPVTTESRNLAHRYPRTTTLDWVTEVPDETAHGAHLALTARAHLAANRATLDLLAEFAPPVERVYEEHENGSVTICLRRARPLTVSPRLPQRERG